MANSEIKQRKTNSAHKQNRGPSDTLKSDSGEETKKVGVTGKKTDIKGTSSHSSFDFRVVLCMLSVTACIVLAWVVLQQNARIGDVEERYKLLYEKSAGVLELETNFVEVSKKLEVSEDNLKGALSSISLITKLKQDITSLFGIITSMQKEQHSASLDIQNINTHFLNVTERWQGSLTSVTNDLMTLKAESRSVHGRMTEQINEAEGRLRALTEQLEELEDSTRRNARAFERTEEEDAQRTQDQLDWNTRQVHRLQEQLSHLVKHDVELRERLEEYLPRAQQCEGHLPAVEEAVRSILRLGSELSSAERRLEELTLQVLGTEDSMLKALSEILELRQMLDTMQVDNSVLKVRNELGVVMETVRELKWVDRELTKSDSGILESMTDELKVSDYNSVDPQ
ncbi:inhibitor of nuclear factor kappa-B kinase-interacting protein isoform X1 [Chanos chanos]|uniref:Inhibitor of nuclear factor kappa-B kinase-interacting protein isoform X1 n=1 Tax=Chanos chanos TaxID=29144 RepID=A0A6J2VQH5_CHACN|nr:inhibitor of nuclear factor kappa-B kinase-interacting protein isoform X1 [Chanos chanos]